MEMNIEQCPEGGEGVVLSIRLEDYELSKEEKRLSQSQWTDF